MKIKWETLKNNAKKSLSQFPYCVENFGSYAVMASLSNSKWKENLSELEKKAFNIINKWDIRLAKKLIDFFPNIVDKKYRNKIPNCFIGDDGEWWVFFE